MALKGIALSEYLVMRAYLHGLSLVIPLGPVGVLPMASYFPQTNTYASAC